MVKFFVPLWNMTLDSSIWMEEDWVFKIWIALLLLKDADFVVRCTPFQIAQRAKKTEQQVLDALKVLSSPDTKRIEKQEYDGCRIKAVEDGWLILNGDKYADLMKIEMRRARNRRSQQAFRNRQRAKQGSAVQPQDPDLQDEVTRLYPHDPVTLSEIRDDLRAQQNEQGS